MFFLEETTGNEDTTSATSGSSGSGQQQQDWTAVWACFDEPHIILGSGLSKAVLDVARNAVAEMRRYYSRKIVDVLVRITRQSIDLLRRKFSDSGTLYNFKFNNHGC